MSAALQPGQWFNEPGTEIKTGMKGNPQTLVIGIGNAYRGDDAVGLRVAALLKERAGDHLTILAQSGEGAALMEAWQDADTVILIDAAQSGAAAGTIHRLDASADDLPRRFLNTSTHAFGVAEAIALARALNQLPPRFLVYAIEGRSFDAGRELSDEVEQAACETSARIVAELRSLPGSHREAQQERLAR